MNKIEQLGELILVKTFYGRHQGSRFGQPDSLENNLQITDNLNDNITHIHIATREQLKGTPTQQSLAIISIIGKGLDNIDYTLDKVSIELLLEKLIFFSLDYYSLEDIQT